MQLPSINNFQLRLGHENAWSDQYGALHVASRYCNVLKTDKLFFNAIWQHGCMEPWFLDSPHSLIYYAPNAEAKSIFVARKEEEDILKKSGYLNSKAIGLPFVYVPEPNLKRFRNSLLVIPIHTLSNQPFESEQALENYADYILSISSRFEKVVACIHPGCLANGYWVKQFGERGIKWVVGSKVDDMNALYRMKALFKQFEYVTTNDWGSHVAYSLSCGAKLSIAGEAPRISDSVMLRDPGMGNNLEDLKNRLYSPQVLIQKEHFLGKFRVDPKDGILDVDLGNWCIGYENILKPFEMRKYFEWTRFHFFWRKALSYKKQLKGLMANYLSGDS